jgi:Ca2+-binding EF-hand superfamily protein
MSSIGSQKIIELLIRQGARNSNQLKVEIDERISTFTSLKEKLINGPQRLRLEDKIANMSQILIAANEQSRFIGTLKGHSKSQAEGTKVRMHSLLETFENVRTVQTFITQELGKVLTTQDDDHGFLNWINKEKKGMEVIMLECDLKQIRALEDEQSRRDRNIQILLDSERLFTFKIDAIQNIIGLEAEMFSFHTQVDRSGAGRLKPVYLLEWIDRNGTMTEEAANSLENVYADISLFYHQNILKMQSCVVFDQDTDSESLRNCRETSTVQMIDPFHSYEWFELFERKPWIQLYKQQMAIQQYKRIQEYIRIHRNDLLTRQVVELQKEKDYNRPCAGRKSQEMLISVEHKRFPIVKAVIRGVVHMKQGIKAKKESSASFLADYFTLKCRTSARGSNPQLPFHLRRNHEIRRMMVNVKTNMMQQQQSITAMSSLKFTMGREESELFAFANDDNATNGIPYYQNRLELGRHSQVVLWIQLSSKVEEFITRVSVVPSKVVLEEKEVHNFISHSCLKGGLLVNRNTASTMVVSSLQVSYSNNSDANILKKEYEMIPCCITAIGDCLINGNLWISLSERYQSISATDINKLERELDEYEDTLSEMPHDQTMQNIVKEMSQRLNIAKIKRVQRRSIEDNPLDYITKFLLIEDRHVKIIRKVFRMIDVDMDGFVSTGEIVKAMKGFDTMIDLIGKLLGIILDEKNQLIVCVDFGGFARGLCSLAVLGKDEMIKLIFSSIDEGGAGFIQDHNYREITQILDPNGNGFAFRALQSEILPGVISFAQFEALHCKYPNALHPLFSFQHSVRESLIGIKYWVRKMRMFAVAKDLVMSEGAFFDK